MSDLFRMRVRLETFMLHDARLKRAPSTTLAAEGSHGARPIRTENLMPSERDKMLAGELYDPFAAELVTARERARDLCLALNNTRESQAAERRRILTELLGAGGDTVWMQPPFHCDYGANIYLGSRVFFNFNCVVLDVCEVRIGDYTLFGPGVQILRHYTR